MAHSRSVGPTQLKPFKIKPDGLVWYPFYDEDQPNYIFSNRFPQPINVSYGDTTLTYPTPAHYFQALKIPFEKDSLLHGQIAIAPTPQEAKTRAATLIADNNLEVNWNDETSYAAMLKVINARVQAPEFKEALINTKNGYFYKDNYSSASLIWGGGKESNGQNQLGRALTEVRNRILTEESKNELLVDFDDLHAKGMSEKTDLVEKQGKASGIPLPLQLQEEEPRPREEPVREEADDRALSGSSSISRPRNDADSAVDINNQIIVALGADWEFEQVPVSETVPSAFTHFKDNKKHSFEMHPDKLFSKDADKVSFTAMLKAFAILHPGMKPSITVSNHRLKKLWQEVCTEMSLSADIKLVDNTPAARKSTSAESEGAEREHAEEEEEELAADAVPEEEALDAAHAEEGAQAEQEAASPAHRPGR
jgi:ribA/ribD-fused uncharacterized protein